ncbi:MAG: VWA domain-containing protein [Candidatus Woesearchaeota archaeon]
MAKQDEGLPNTIIPHDEKQVKEGALIQEAINQGVGSFQPDLAFENLTKNYKNAKRLYGETIIRELTGYSPDYVEKNINIPEFKRHLKQQIKENADKLKDEGVINKDYVVTDKGLKLATISLLTEELDQLSRKGIGEPIKHLQNPYGDKKDYEQYSKGRYRDVALKQSVKTAARRMHSELQPEDLKKFTREAKGHHTIIYAMDCSGSMRGEKLKTSKKAGVALAYKAIEDRNKVGLIVFHSDVKSIIEPCRDFSRILNELSKARAGMETDLVKVMRASVTLFGNDKSKHLVLLTDALPTKGTEPENDTIKAASMARNAGITISLVGIQLDKKGEELAKRIVEVGEGRLYLVKDLMGVDSVVLEDYYSLR